jgi:hypothetical protein
MLLCFLEKTAFNKSNGKKMLFRKKQWQKNAF